MHFEGATIGLLVFVIIGVFHPMVIKTEYYYGKNVWPIYFIIGWLFVGFSIFTENTILSVILGVIGFSCLWSIGELIEQEQRVKKGWFPKNPNR
jgi:hypothetical protein